MPSARQLLAAPHSPWSTCPTPSAAVGVTTHSTMGMMPTMIMMPAAGHSLFLHGRRPRNRSKPKAKPPAEVTEAARRLDPAPCLPIDKAVAKSEAADALAEARALAARCQDTLSRSGSRGLFASAGVTSSSLGLTKSGATALSTAATLLKQHGCGDSGGLGSSLPSSAATVSAQDATVDATPAKKGTVAEGSTDDEPGMVLGEPVDSCPAGAKRPRAGVAMPARPSDAPRALWAHPTKQCRLSE